MISCPILYVDPTEDLIEQTSKKRIPILTDIVITFGKKFHSNFSFGSILSQHILVYSLCFTALVLSVPDHPNLRGLFLETPVGPGMFLLDFCQKIKKIYHLFNLPTSLKNLLGIY